MGDIEKKNLSERELKLYHEYFADSTIDPNAKKPKNSKTEKNETKHSSIKKEESKLRRSLSNRDDIPTEIWMG